MQQITEEMKVHEEWYKEAEKMTLDALPEFVNRLMNEYGHDYGTICHALTAGAIATLHAMDDHPQGGISGFQGGCIMWEFIRNWMYSNNKTGLKLIDYDNFLYPQDQEKFEKLISADTWAAIKKEAQKNIDEANKKHEQYLKDLDIYNETLKDFINRYPDYEENPSKYNHLDCGTEDEWEAEEKKKKSGFEFAPRKPYEGVYGNRVYCHWQSIVDDMVPFGYVVTEEDN